MGVYYLEDENLWFDDVNSIKRGGIGAVTLSKSKATIKVFSNDTQLFKHRTITITNGEGVTKTFKFTALEPYIYTGDVYDGKIQVSLRNPLATTQNDIALAIFNAITHENGFKDSIKLELVDGTPAIINLTQNVNGREGNTEIIENFNDSSVLTTTNFEQGGLTCTGGPILRIGTKIDQQPILPGSVVNPIDEGTRIGKVTLFSDYQDISYLEGYVQGKNVKNMQQFFKMNMPLIRSNNCQYYKSQRLSGQIDHKLSITRDISVAQGDSLKRELRQSPFNDLMSMKFIPADQIRESCRQGKPFTEMLFQQSYPIVTDSIINFESYNDPDAVDTTFNGGYFKDGSIEPLGIRNSFANPNTGFSNILISGIKGSFMPYHQEQGDWSDNKGSSILDNKYEFRQTTYDWFEDAQDLAVPENVFARMGDRSMTDNDRYLSLFGYVSDGVYGIAPFVDLDVDKRYFKNKYRQLGDESAVSRLLKNSSRTLSNIGTRFKSANSGVILNPVYDSINQNVFGTDSIAFLGLVKG